MFWIETATTGIGRSPRFHQTFKTKSQ